MISNEMCLLSDIFQNTKIESQKAVNDKISEQNTGPLSNTESTEKIPNKFLSKKTNRKEDPNINADICFICGKGNELVLCNNCQRTFHLRCLRIPEENFSSNKKIFCMFCALKLCVDENNISKEKMFKSISENEKKFEMYGVIYPYFNGGLFNKIINIYDYLMTFSNKIYLSYFSLEELYSSIKFSESYKEGEISLLNSIHISLIYIFLKELQNIQLSSIKNNGDNELLLIKIITNYYDNEIKNLYSFIYESWPELIRIIIISKSYGNNSIMTKEAKININKKFTKVKNIINYNNELNLDDKLNILEELISKSYDTDFIRNIVNEAREKKILKKKIEKEIKDTDIKIKDIEKQRNPLERMDKLNKYLTKLNQINNISVNQSEIEELKNKIESEKNKENLVVKELNELQSEKENLSKNLYNINLEIIDNPILNKKFIGFDEKGNKYFYFSWMKEKIFIRIKDNKNTNNYEWRVIDKKENIKILIEKLSYSKMNEKELKTNLVKIHKEIKNNNNETNKTQTLNNINIEDIFKNNTLKYVNTKNQMINEKSNKNSKKNNEYEKIDEKLCKIEDKVTSYLKNDDKQWESIVNRTNIRYWLTYINDISQYANFLIFITDKMKNPYCIKINSNKVIMDLEDTENEDSKNIISNNGNLNVNYINNNLEEARKIRLWAKELDAINIEKIYKNYLIKTTSFAALNIGILFFEIIFEDLWRRRTNYGQKNYKIKKNKKETGKLEIKINDDEISKNSNRKKRKLLKKEKIEIIIDKNNKKCMFCNEEGNLIFCQDCSNAVHIKCLGLVKKPEVWLCNDCLKKISKGRITRNLY